MNGLRYKGTKVAKMQKSIDESMPFAVSDADGEGHWIVATGFTTSYLGDERTLREFIVGDYIARQLRCHGKNVHLYLINDSYDPLQYGELRIGLQKDERLLKKWQPYCGQPIAEVPDPFGCHESYAEHFAAALLDRLHDLDIHPVLLDTYQAYRSGNYAPFVRTTLANHDRIQALIAEQFCGYTLRKLFSPQCPCCKRLDQTRVIRVVAETVTFACDHCGTIMQDHIEEIHGKLAWKLDCAARWNLYNIHLETFSKNHLNPLGSFAIARFLSEQFFGSRVPQPVHYGVVHMDKDMSMRLLEFMPPSFLKKYFTRHIPKDMTVNRDTVYNFCCQVQVRPDLSYVDYVKKDLAIQAISAQPEAIVTPPHEGPGINSHDLLRYGNRFSLFYYGREFGVSLPVERSIRAADRSTARIAEQIITDCLFLRDHGGVSAPGSSRAAIAAYLQQRADISPAVYHYLREVFGQRQGPNIKTLLSLLPMDYLRNVIIMIRMYCELEQDREAYHDRRRHLRDWNMASLSVAVGKAYPGGKTTVTLRKCNV
jgi:hypothetical protein